MSGLSPNVSKCSIYASQVWGASKGRQNTLMANQKDPATMQGPSQEIITAPYQVIQPSAPAVQNASFVSRIGATKIGSLTDSALKNPTRIVGGPGSGKSRYLGRVIGWQVLVRNMPQVILDPTGGVTDNLIDKIMRCDKETRQELWKRVLYVDVAATDYIVPSPLYYRLRPTDTLLEIANRFPAVVKRIDPALSGAPILGLNALNEAAISAGRIAAALGRQVDFVADLIDHTSQYKEDLRQALAQYPELEDAVEYFRQMIDPTRGDLRERRTGSLRSKLLPFLADPTMLATFATSERGIDWEKVTRLGQTVLLDFRNELDSERRQFKLVWWFRDVVDYVRARGTAGRGHEIFFVIDEVTQLLGPQTGDGRSILAEDLNELVAVFARGYGANTFIAHQNLTQVSESVRDILSQCGNQIIGNITSPDDRLYLARQFFVYDPYMTKKKEPIWMSVAQFNKNGFSVGYSEPKVIDFRDVEYTPDEQLLLAADKFHLPRFQFLVRPATAEGMISDKLYRISIENIDRNQFPDAGEVRQVLAYLREKDGIPLETLLTEIRNRRKTHGKAAATIKKHDNSIPLYTQEEEDEDEIIREKA